MKIGRGLAWVLGALVLVFGILALHYTFFVGVEHHQEWATEHGMPAPSFLIFVIGAAATIAGAGVIGLLLGSTHREAPMP